MCVCIYIYIFCLIYQVLCHTFIYTCRRYVYILLFNHSVMSDSATLCTTALQASLSYTISWSLLKLMSIESVMPSNYPLSSPSPSAFNLSQHQVLFQWVSSSHEQNRNINNKRDKTKPWGNSRTKKYKMLNENFTRGIQMQIWASSRICKSENRTIEIIEFEEQKKKN